MSEDEGPCFALIVHVAEIAAGLSVADKIKETGDLSNQSEAERIHAELLKEFFEGFPGYHGSGFIKLADGKVSVIESKLFQIVTELFARSEIRQSA